LFRHFPKAIPRQSSFKETIEWRRIGRLLLPFLFPPRPQAASARSVPKMTFHHIRTLIFVLVFFLRTLLGEPGFTSAHTRDSGQCVIFLSPLIHSTPFLRLSHSPPLPPYSPGLFGVTFPSRPGSMLLFFGDGGFFLGANFPATPNSMQDWSPSHFLSPFFC